MSYFDDMCDEDFSIDGLDAEDMKALDAFEVPVVSDSEMASMNAMMASEIELDEPEEIEDVVIPVVPEMKLEKTQIQLEENNGQMAFVF